jgi:hypothetical protein
MDVSDAMCRTILFPGARRGAMMATIRFDQPDIRKFIAAWRQQRSASDLRRNRFDRPTCHTVPSLAGGRDPPAREPT